MRRIAYTFLLIILCLCVLNVCLAVPGCTHPSSTYSETWQKKNELLYCYTCPYYTGYHAHIHQFWNVNGIEKCDKCGKAWISASYTVNIRTFCPFGPF